ncbi:hypothetical protein JZU51_02955, partial [bacterium]|nr:hypothetical protein [bacterium]
LRDEPASKTLLTLSALAHPQWNVHPTKFDVAHAMMFALNTDLIRAQLLTEIIYRPQNVQLSTFDAIKPETQERITYALGERFTNLRNWLDDYRQSAPQPLDFFLRRLPTRLRIPQQHGRRPRSIQFDRVHQKIQTSHGTDDERPVRS